MNLTDWCSLHLHMVLYSGSVLVSSLVRQAHFILIVPIAKKDAILEICWTIIMHMNSMHIYLQLLGSFLIQLCGKAKNLKFSELFRFWSLRTRLGEAMAEIT